MIRIYTDGACADNGKEKNIGSYGFVVVDEDNIIYEYADKVPNTTNNRMELTAIIKALEYYKFSNYNNIVIFSDSKYCINGIQTWMWGWEKKNWKRAKDEEVKNKDLWKQLIVLNKELKNIKYQWVKGHNGNIWNEYIDEKIVSLYQNKSMEEKIEIKLFDIGEEIIEKDKPHSCYMILYEDYIKTFLEISTLEKEDKESTGDDILDELTSNDVNVTRKEIRFINKSSIDNLILSYESSSESIWKLYIVCGVSDYFVYFQSEKEANKVLSLLQQWRWKK